MAQKFHISDDGKVAVCKASPGKCPKQNFDTIQAAEDHLEETYGGNAKSRRMDSKALKSYPAGTTTPYTMSLPEATTDLLDELYEVGNPLIVGGSVRDSINGADVKDYDIEVHGSSMDELITHLRGKGYLVDEVGKQFGVLKINRSGHSEEEDFDVSVPRRENINHEGGHRGFDVQMDKNMTVHEASLRRDFTFNAMMYDHRNGVIVDSVGGKTDFDNNTMRHVSHQFAEDPLRVLRGFQFASRFGMSYAPETAELCQSIRGTYGTLAKERVREEWDKFYTKGTDHAAGIKALQDSGWDDISPGLKESLASDKTMKAMSRLNSVPKDKRTVYGSAAITSNMNKKEREAFLNISMVNDDSRKKSRTLVTGTPDTVDDVYSRKMFALDLDRAGLSYHDYRAYGELIGDSKRAKVADNAIREGIGDRPEPFHVMGRDIMDRIKPGTKTGPWMGKLITEFRDRQYRGDIKDKDEALRVLDATLVKMNLR